MLLDVIDIDVRIRYRYIHMYRLMCCKFLQLRFLRSGYRFKILGVKTGLYLKLPRVITAMYCRHLSRLYCGITGRFMSAIANKDRLC